MPRIKVEIPTDMWQRIQDYYGIQNINTHARLHVERLINDGERTAPWMNGHVVPAKITSPIVKKDLDSEVEDLINQMKEPSPPPKIRSRPPTFWTSDAHMAAELSVAIAEFRKHVLKFWKNKYSPSEVPLTKTPQEVINFLDDHEGDTDASQYAAGPWSYMCVIRKVHRNWWQDTHK